MPIVRVSDEGQQTALEIKEKKKNYKARIVAAIATVTVVSGGALFFTGQPAHGLCLMILGNATASIWNLADDS